MTSTTYSRDATVAAITDFYKFYIRLPYLDSNALVLAPEDGGWPNIDATELRNRGKSDEVIELLRHLSYIEHPDFRGGWTIDSGSDCIQYHKGACYNNNPDLIKSLPGHVIPIADPTDRNGCYLLLDTQTGKITRYNIMANNIEGNWDEYERLDDNDKWRAFPTAPVGRFFGRWIKLYEKLVWMVAPPVDDSHGDGGIYFTRADNAVEENELLEADDDEDFEIEDEFTKVHSHAVKLSQFTNVVDRRCTRYTSATGGQEAHSTGRLVRVSSRSTWGKSTIDFEVSKIGSRVNFIIEMGLFELMRVMNHDIEDDLKNNKTSRIRKHVS
jgi:3D (Asp-Asp-Asp) domain-containing protein